MQGDGKSAKEIGAIYDIEVSDTVTVIWEIE